jgi:outer membrane protein OmpA-like peptidoglycan-associated protein
MRRALQHCLLCLVLASTASGCAYYQKIAKRYQPRPHIIAVEEAPEQIAQRAAARKPVNVATNIGVEGDLPTASQSVQTLSVPSNVIPRPPRVVAETIALRPERLFNQNSRARKLSAKGKQELDRLASQLTRYHAKQQLVKVAIVDYSENGQSAQAQRRVQLVRDYLAGKGVDRAIVETGAPRPSKVAGDCKGKKAKRPECRTRDARMEVVIRKRT